MGLFYLFMILLFYLLLKSNFAVIALKENIFLKKVYLY